jgi:hypothetical protein
MGTFKGSGAKVLQSQIYRSFQRETSNDPHNLVDKFNLRKDTLNFK